MDLNDILREAIRRAEEESNPKVRIERERKRRVKLRVAVGLAIVGLIVRLGLFLAVLYSAVNAFHAADVSNWPKATFYTAWVIIDLGIVTALNRKE
jgi:hypothetical protein